MESDKEPLYIPYKFQFKIGDILSLKDDDALWLAYLALQSEIPQEGAWLSVDWMPSLNILSQLKGISLNVVGFTSFHCGYPLYELSFEYREKACQIRLCEPLLKKLSPVPATAAEACTSKS
jgi:hypothetical protein